ncbi:AMP-binding protein [Phaeovulum sp. NW3]|uniref:phenylacetate--CoA ligase family protein n=1 Tax=Phaeovulum sp. NW3 TaxID=2934933 RepID=UPI0020228175|nr:AMP-binding protein [Phaeovulum sp. NW3]MCL7466276.1 AMP-binding protein [Phaeovulum sp. NW3]
MIQNFTLPDLLRVSPAALRNLQNRLISQQVALCYEHSPYYSALMRREGIEPRHIQSVDDLEILPPSSKYDFLADPEAFRLRPEGLPLHEGLLTKVIYTTGTTTGRPAPIYVTSHDQAAYTFGFQERQDLIGLKSTDRVCNLFPLTSFPLGAYSRAVDEIAAVGATIMYAHTGRSDVMFPINRSLDSAVETIARHRATVLWGVAGFVRRVMIRAIEMGADFTALRMIMTTGEASSPAMREDFRQRMRQLGAADTLVVNRYGSTEQGGTMIECCEGSGFHSGFPDQLFHEIINEDTGKRLPDGEQGMLAFSHLNRRGTVFLRYKVGDLGSMDHSVCPHCGRSAPRLSSNTMRTGDVIKIRGVLVNLGNLKGELDKMPHLDEYQIVIASEDPADPFSMDRFIIRIAPGQAAHHDLAERVVAEVRALTNMRAEVEIVDRSEIYDPITMAKPRRIVDQRQTR